MCAAAARCTSGRSDGDRDRRRGCRGGRAQRARRGQPARRRRLGGRRPGGDRPHRRGGPLGRDPAVTAASVDRFAAGDGEAWLRMYAQWLATGGDLLDALFTPFPPVRPAVALLRRLRVADALRLARRFLLPVRVLGDAQRIPDALAARLAKRGGRIVTEARVDRVVVGRGRALGVRSADGRFWRASRAVLADVAAPVLYRDLVEPAHLPPRLLADLDRFRWDYATLKVDWALSAPVPWRAATVAGAGTVHLGGDQADLTRYAAALAAGQVPERPFVLLGQMTTADASRSPAGTESMWGYTHLPRRDEWPAGEIDAHVARTERAVEECAPGFGALVVGRHVAGPQELWAENPSLVGGAINGGTAAPYQQLLFRPVPGLGRADTPIDRLYLASSSAHPGGGMHGAPGANAARAALARHRAVSGGVYGAGVRLAHRRLYA